MQIRVRVFGHIVIEHDVDTLNIHPAAEQIRSDQDALLEIFELLVTGQPTDTKVSPSNQP